ncbi:spore germination protein [Bacillus salitolerans]|uniref:Spore germination protein n=1 Tax=Bacillus salitolerans TaxID=1437434 RepID=A0ABW4LPN9_9BACI
MNKSNSPSSSDMETEQSTYKVNINIDKDLKLALTTIKSTLGNCKDIIVREFVLGEQGKQSLAVIYVDGLVNQTLIQDFILKTLMIDIRATSIDDSSILNFKQKEIIEKFSLAVSELNEVKTYGDIYNSILSGDTVILLNGWDCGFSVGSKGWDKRAVEEPSSQTTVRGPKEGFTETLRTNTALIRRRIKDPNLRIDHMQVGQRTKTDIAIAYIHGLATDSIVKELKDRINRIEVDSILESGYIEEFIQDETYSPFPTIYNSERPDAICGGILEGRIGIIVDGTPFVLLAPAIFVQFFQSPEDYYQRSDISILLRLLRVMSFLLALLVPSAYIAVTTFHQEMLPTTLLISLAAQREGVPFPAFVEALLMEITFEIIREAGIRMPRAVGSAISIVGALVLGQAAVEAGIVSATMVIVVSLTAISSFVLPEFNLSISIRILRFMFMILAASFGLFGIILGLIVMITHLVNLRSFGVPYLTPMAPYIREDQKDAIIRLPHWALGTRPRLISQQDSKRNQTPAPEPEPNASESKSEKTTDKTKETE